MSRTSTEELNPYLLDTVLPQLEGEEPIRLEQNRL